MVVPIDKEEAINKPESDAVALEEVGHQSCAGEYLRDLRPGLHCASHSRVDLNLQVEERRVVGFGFGDAVEEVVQQQEVVVEMFEGQRGGRRRRRRSRGLGLRHYNLKIITNTTQYQKFCLFSGTLDCPRPFPPPYLPDNHLCPSAIRQDCFSSLTTPTHLWPPLPTSGHSSHPSPTFPHPDYLGFQLPILFQQQKNDHFFFIIQRGTLSNVFLQLRSVSSSRWQFPTSAIMSAVFVFSSSNFLSIFLVALSILWISSPGNSLVVSPKLYMCFICEMKATFLVDVALFLSLGTSREVSWCAYLQVLGIGIGGKLSPFNLKAGKLGLYSPSSAFLFSKVFFSLRQRLKLLLAGWYFCSFLAIFLLSGFYIQSSASLVSSSLTPRMKLISRLMLCCFFKVAELASNSQSQGQTSGVDGARSWSKASVFSRGSSQGKVTFSGVLLL